jgi:hypothetical protein
MSLRDVWKRKSTKQAITITHLLVVKFRFIYNSDIPDAESVGKTRDGSLARACKLTKELQSSMVNVNEMFNGLSRRVRIGAGAARIEILEAETESADGTVGCIDCRLCSEHIDRPGRFLYEDIPRS